MAPSCEPRSSRWALPPTAAAASLWVFCAVVSAVAGHPAQGNQETREGITDALYLIAKNIQANHAPTILFERVALLEASLSESEAKSSLLEERLSHLETRFPGMDSRLESLSNLLSRMDTLEQGTNALMRGFEEKLSTLARELLRWKRVGARKEGMEARQRKAMRGSGGTGGTAAKREELGEGLIEETREVDEESSRPLPVAADDVTRGLSIQDTSEENSFGRAKNGIQFGDLQEKCLPSSVPASSVPASSVPASSVPGSSVPASDCVFTSGGRVSTWKEAKGLCQAEGGELVTPEEGGRLFQGITTVFWVSEISIENMTDNELNVLGRKFKHFMEDFEEDQFQPTPRSSGAHSDEVVSIFSLDDDMRTDSIGNSSEFVDIRNLPDSELQALNIDRNVYIARIDDTLSLTDNPEGEERKRLSRRSIEEFLRLKSLESDKNINIHKSKGIRYLPVLGAQNDVLNLSLLNSEDTENISSETENNSFFPNKGSTNNNFRYTNSDAIERHLSVSDSQVDGNVPPLSNPSSESALIDRFSALRKDRLKDKYKKCPVLACKKEPSQCSLMVTLCSDLTSFWCKRKL